MRGKLWYTTRLTHDLRNIPAYAGKTSHHRRPRRRNEEHPRVCGENYRDRQTAAAAAGTSPRMRGKPPTIPDTCNGPGNIPAYAGKTFHYRVIPAENQEHPRVCGENFEVGEAHFFVEGTSPRMRGKQN